MSIAQGQKILATDYNYIAQIVKDILGVGTGTTGYGQSTLTTLITGTPLISHTDWTNLRTDMSSIRLHQSGIAIGSVGNNLPISSVGGLITSADALEYNSLAQTLNSDRFKVAMSQLVSNSPVDDSIGAWNNTLTYTYTFTGDTTGSGSAENIRFYFNSGSIIRLNLSIPTGSGNAKQEEWATLLNNKYFYINNISFKLGTADYSTATTVNSYGWNSLLTTDTELYSTSCPTRPLNTLKLFAKKTATAIIITIVIVDGDTSGVDIDITDLTFSSLQYYPNRINPIFSILPLTRTGVDTGGGLSPKVISIVPDSTSIREGSTVTFTINTSNITAATTYYWKKTSGSTIPDNRLSISSGSVTITNSNSITKSITINTDQNNYADQTLGIQLYIDSGFTQPFGTSSDIVTIVGSTKFYSMTSPVTLAGGDFMNSNIASEVLTTSANNILTGFTFVNDSYTASRVDPVTYYPLGSITISGVSAGLANNPSGYVLGSVISTISPGTVGSITGGAGTWTATITNMTSTFGYLVGDPITATNGTTGKLYGGTPTSVQVASIISSTSMTYTVTGGSTPVAGDISNITHNKKQAINSSYDVAINPGTGAISYTLPNNRLLTSVDIYTDSANDPAQNGSYIQKFEFNVGYSEILNSSYLPISENRVVHSNIATTTYEITPGVDHSHPNTVDVSVPSGKTIRSISLNEVAGNKFAAYLTITTADTVIYNGVSMTILPASLNSMTAGAVITNITLSTSGGNPPYTYAVTTGALPNGLSLTNGVISGTPTTSGSYSFTITSTDSSSNSITKSYMGTIFNNNVTVVLSPSAMPTFEKNTYASVEITASGGTSPYTYALVSGTLPAGMTFDQPNPGGSGFVAGTPTTDGTGTFTLRAIDSASNVGTRQYNYTVTATSNGSGTLSLLPTFVNAMTVGTTISDITITASGGTNSVSYTYSISGLPAGLTYSNQPLYGTTVISGTPTTVATGSFTVNVTDTVNNTLTGSRIYSYTVSPGTFSINYPVNLGGPYDTGSAITPIQFTTLNGVGNVTYAITSGTIPSGITLSSSGLLSGTPTSVGNYSITVTATDSYSTPRTATKSYSIVITTPGPLLTVSSSGSFMVGDTLFYTISGCSANEYFDIYFGNGSSDHPQFSPSGTYSGSFLLTTAGTFTMEVIPVSGPTPASVTYTVYS